MGSEGSGKWGRWGVSEQGAKLHTTVHIRQSKVRWSVNWMY